ncbi:MAG: antibiotic biosynthesis monooxygenase [Thermoleophilia bacterium]|nr:antibiotic biosynthesis monooxygenase [Thermoleophilia bacterium]
MRRAEQAPKPLYYREAFLDEFRRLVPLVLAEEGCLEYGPAVDEPTDISAQGPPRPDTVVVVEKWESVAHLKAHLAAPHMEAYRPRVRDLVKSTTLQILAPA